jgi:hypothetical protein
MAIVLIIICPLYSIAGTIDVTIKGIGPDVLLTWFEAKSWIEGLHIDGGGWRLPTILELKTIYKFQGLNTDLPKIFRKKTTKSVVW